MATLEAESNAVGERLKGTAPDLWPNMVMLYVLRSKYEATGDKRILDFMTRYFRWQATLPRDKYLSVSWQHVRGGDNLDSIYWLYNRTGDAFLLDLARRNHESTADWTTGIASWHGVNIAECFREPAQFYQQSRDAMHLKATERNYATVREQYGQVPGGMYGADENARPGYTGARQGTEACSFAEMMWSDEMLLAITGNPVWADRAEEIAFNSLPASMTPDLKGLHYLTAPNQIQLDRSSKAPMIQNRGDMFSYNPHQYRCCQHNVAFAWPYYSEHLWMATGNNGLAAVFYAYGEVRAKVGKGGEVRITEQTDYPFDDSVNFTIATDKPVRFPLLLRIPAWCDNPKLAVNGKAVASTKGWTTVERTWNTGDRIRLELPMRVTVTRWTKNRNSVSINRGPLTYSLKIGERWERKEGTDQWPGLEVYPTTPWNYGLIVSSVQFSKTARLAAQPFASDSSPVILHAKGKRIPLWKQEDNGLVGEVPQGPVHSDQPAEDITLIPMGCARLRISAFPEIAK